jgi:hypothetical protein
MDPLEALIAGAGGPEPITQAPYPNAGAPAPAVPAPPVQTTPDHKNILASILPLLAAGLASHQGGLPGYAHASYGVAQDRQRLEQENADRALQQHRYEQTVQMAQQKEQAAEAARAAAQQAGVDRADNAFLLDWLKRVEGNDETVHYLNNTPAESYSIHLPSGKNLPLTQFFDKFGLPDRKFHSASENRVPAKPSLITGSDEKGRPVRVEDKAGVTPYERPRAPKEAAKPTRRAYTWKDDDPDSASFGKSFRIVEDENGNEIKKTPISGAAGAAPPKPVASSSKYSIGQSVTLKSGQKVTIKKINSDGTFDY